MADGSLYRNIFRDHSIPARMPSLLDLKYRFALRIAGMQLRVEIDPHRQYALPAKRNAWIRIYAIAPSTWSGPKDNKQMLKYPSLDTQPT